MENICCGSFSKIGGENGKDRKLGGHFLCPQYNCKCIMNSRAFVPLVRGGSGINYVVSDPFSALKATKSMLLRFKTLLVLLPLPFHSSSPTPVS